MIWHGLSSDSHKSVFHYQQWACLKIFMNQAKRERHGFKYCSMLLSVNSDGTYFPRFWIFHKSLNNFWQLQKQWKSWKLLQQYSWNFKIYDFHYWIYWSTEKNEFTPTSFHDEHKLSPFCSIFDWLVTMKNAGKTVSHKKLDKINLKTVEESKQMVCVTFWIFFLSYNIEDTFFIRPMETKPKSAM